jgi:hypothetical protein
MPRIATLFAALLLAVSPAFAAGDGLPFGFDKVQWGMSHDALVAASPVFANLPAPANEFSPHPKVLGYRWHDCTFDIDLGLGFYHGLGALTLTQANVSQACVAAVRAALVARYGDPWVGGNMKDYGMQEWHSGVTVANLSVFHGADASSGPNLTIRIYVPGPVPGTHP